MSVAGNYTPLNINLIASYLQNQGLRINPTAQTYMGVSNDSATYSTHGTIYTDTLLELLSNVTELAYAKVVASSLSTTTYNNLIAMGVGSCPILGNAKPASYDLPAYGGEAAKFGWLRLIALQAKNEFKPKPISNYSDFCNSFTAMDAWRTQMNKTVSSYISGSAYLTGSFSNMNDLISNDITGVNLATVYWGQDLIRSGRVINLSSIDTFGLPSDLLRTLAENKALIPSLNLALLSSGLTQLDILGILNGIVATPEQERLIYSSFNIITGPDLSDVCTLVNCQTTGLDSLADFLNPKKLFPNSYKSLTYPIYNTTNSAANSKIYYLIYNGDEANTSSSQYVGLRLQNILPQGIAFAADAFSIAMSQIKNIKSQNIEKFSQVVTNLENVAGNDVGATSQPTPLNIAQTGISYLGLGSGYYGTFQTIDFFGAMSGLGYNWRGLYDALKNIPVTELVNKYQDMYVLLSGSGPYDSALQTYINEANAIIAGYVTTYSREISAVNTIYEQFGAQLERELLIRGAALPNITDMASSITNIYSFVDALSQYGVETEDNGPCQVLEQIADTTNIGGNCLIGSMREVRNQARLGLSGMLLDSGIPTTPITLPPVNGSTTRQNPVFGFTNTGPTSDIPIVTGSAIVPGSLAGSPELALIPPNLSIFNIGVINSAMTPEEAVAVVTINNCDCWS